MLSALKSQPYLLIFFVRGGMKIGFDISIKNMFTI
jgi:hypothetical protein